MASTADDVVLCANCGQPIEAVVMTGIAVWIHARDAIGPHLFSKRSCITSGVSGPWTRAWPAGRAQWQPTPGANP